jgi:hypothetical protein
MSNRHLFKLKSRKNKKKEKIDRDEFFIVAKKKKIGATVYFGVSGIFLIRNNKRAFLFIKILQER